MSEFVALIPQACMVLGALAFVVSVIVEVIKNIGFMKDIYTDIVVMVISVLITVVAYFAYADYAAVATTWYMIVGTVIGGFFVAFLSMFGWTKFNELWKKFSNDNQ